MKNFPSPIGLPKSKIPALFASSRKFFNQIKLYEVYFSVHFSGSKISSERNLSLTKAHIVHGKILDANEERKLALARVLIVGDSPGSTASEFRHSFHREIVKRKGKMDHDNVTLTLEVHGDPGEGITRLIPLTISFLAPSQELKLMKDSHRRRIGKKNHTISN